MNLRHVTRSSALLVATSLAACSESAMENEGIAAAATLVSVRPAAGASQVGIASAIEVGFDNPIATASVDVIALQIGECPGPVVSGQWMLSEDRRVLRFTPLVPLMPGTMYSIHVGGGMMDAAGGAVDLEQHGPGMGGQWVTAAMANGMVGTGMGMGMGVNHTGTGWRHANGMYGLAFSFTTGVP